MVGNKSKTDLGHAADKKGTAHSEHSEHPVATFITFHSGYFVLPSTPVGAPGTGHPV